MIQQLSWTAALESRRTRAADSGPLFFVRKRKYKMYTKKKDERNVAICPAIQAAKKAGARKERAACLFAFCFLAFLYKEEISGTVRGLQI